MELISNEKHTVQLTVEEITFITSALWRYESDCRMNGMKYSAGMLDDLYESFHRITCRAYGWKENENAKEIEVK